MCLRTENDYNIQTTKIKHLFLNQKKSKYDIILAMKLIFVRHGETDANVGGILQGKLESTLTEKGEKQSREVGKKLKEKYPKIDLVFCSPLKRTVETLNTILEEYPIECEVLMSNLIEERGFGEYEGTEDYLIDWEEINKDNPENRKMGVESVDKMIKRCELFLEDLKLEEGKETILIVSHAGPIRIMLDRIADKEIDFEEKVENGSITEVDYDTELEY